MENGSEPTSFGFGEVSDDDLPTKNSKDKNRLIADRAVVNIAKIWDFVDR